MTMNNYEKAKIEADKIDCQIIGILKEKKNFRVEAGAGSGKTYSLNQVIKWLIENKKTEFLRKKQKVICITYTNIAVEVINNRIDKETFIVPSTIHSFAWEAIKQYRNELINLINNTIDLNLTKDELEKINLIQYTLGVRYIDGSTLYLYHNDVLKLFCALLDNEKFRIIFENKYPLILIDEYQDSHKEIIDRFLKYFIAKDSKLQFGFFGDSWQTIYSTNGACGFIENEKIIEIRKNANFRSATNIVNILNKIRPDLPQISAIDEYEGEVCVIDNNDFKGVRRTDNPYKEDLPLEILKERLENVNKVIKKNIIHEEQVNNLMITHSMLANQQGYINVLNKFGDKFKENDDEIISFINDMVEPIYIALESANMTLLFGTLGIKRYPINTKKEKIKWKNLQANLKESRQKRIIDVLEVCVDSKLIPIPNKILMLNKEYKNEPDKIYIKDTIKNTLEINYTEFESAVKFLNPTSEYDTNHGVKGNEFENVIFSITGGWNLYQFDKYIPMINNKIPSDKVKSFERNRNLFYVCCSRPKKRLYIFISILASEEFKSYLLNLVGKENYYNYSDFIEKFVNGKIK